METLFSSSDQFAHMTDGDDETPTEEETEAGTETPAAEESEAGDETAAGDESEAEKRPTDDVESENSEEDPAAEEDAEDSAADDDEESDDEATEESAEDEESEDGDAEESADEESEPEQEDAETEPELTEEALEERLADASDDVAAAETEADLDEVEGKLDRIEADIEAADLPEPDEDDEDAEDPRADLESELENLREEVAEKRGPYASDVVSDVEDARSKIADTRWTERGETEIVEVVEAFTSDVEEILGGEFGPDGTDEDALVAALDDVVAAVEDADLDPDEDADTIAALLEATDELQSGLDDAQEWDDLEVRAKLQAEGFYDVLGHYKDYPPEWSALKEWEKRGNVEMVLLALDLMESDFMEEHCVEALTRMNDQAAYDAMAQLANRRDKPAIKALGKMGAEDAVETLVDYVDTDSDPALQRVTFKALGEIGSEEATQALANKLEMDNDEVRPYAARALGLIGDPRAIDPLSDALEEDDDDRVRTAAGWALRQIGTERALEALSEYADDRSYMVQREAQRADETLDPGAKTA